MINIFIILILILQSASTNNEISIETLSNSATPDIFEPVSYRYKYPFPFYIFVIGFNKCGTGSLWSLFQQNGIPSIHYARFGSIAPQKDKYGNYIYSLPQIMTDLYLQNQSFISYSNLSHKYMFYSDFGVYPGFPTMHNITTPFYEILLKQNPNIKMKFILNIRNVNKWIKSRYFHGSMENKMFIDFYRNNNNRTDIDILNQWKNTWYNYMCHTLEYFRKINPNDLLIFDIEHDSVDKIINYFDQYGLHLDGKFYHHKGNTKKLMKRAIQREQRKKYKQIITVHAPQFLKYDGDDGFDDEYHRILNICKLKPLKFYIFQNYSEKIKNYFRNCNISSIYGNRGKNRYSHLGEQYFDYQHLKNHKWKTKNINDADIVILPIYLTMSKHGYCDTINNYKKKKKEKQFQSMVSQFFLELNDFAMRYNDKIYLLMGSDPKLCELPKPLSMIEFASKYKLIVGHYAKPSALNRTCFWMNSKDNDDNTIIIPYTIPFKYNQYNKVYNDFHTRKYELFYMGSACTASKRNKYAMKHRADAIKYMDIINKNENKIKHFGVITDYDDSDDSDCIKYSNIDINKIKKCDKNMQVSPCGLIKGEDKLNKNNNLYHYGLIKSKFNLMIHGDTPSSGKFYDSLVFNMINIMIGINKNNLDKYLPFTHIIPYEKFVFFLSEKEFEENGINALQNIIYNTSNDNINYMINNMTHYKKYLLWNHDKSLVVDSILLQTKNKSN